MNRPLPPASMLEPSGPAFLPAPEVGDFVHATFLNPASPLCIPEHAPLADADIGYLWAAPEARDKGRRILGTAQLLTPPQPKWGSLRAFDQLARWFGAVDFIVTLSAPYCLEEASDAEFLALLDHEHCHCAQRRDSFGEPRFSRETGRPLWEIRGHDVEQFTGVVARWGASAAGVAEMVAAAQQPPRFGHADVRRVLEGCGTCLKAA